MLKEQQRADAAEIAQANRRNRKAEIEKQEQEEWKKNRGYNEEVLNKLNVSDKDHEQHIKQRRIQLALQNNIKLMEDME